MSGDSEMYNQHVFQYFTHFMVEAFKNGKEFYGNSMCACALRESSDEYFFEINGALELPDEISF